MTETAEKKDVVPSEYRDKYKATGGTNGDFIAVALSKVAEDGLEALGTVKAENGIDKARWAGFNPGMQRMNLANVLRGSFLKGETIKILGKEYNAKHLAADFNGTLADDPKVLAKVADMLGLVAQGQTASDRVIAALQKLFFAPAKPSAEDRAAAKKVKDDAKAAEKQAKTDAAAKAKADKAETAAKAKADKAEAAAKAKADKTAAADAAKAKKAADKKAADEAKVKVAQEAAALKAKEDAAKK